MNSTPNIYKYTSDLDVLYFCSKVLSEINNSLDFITEFFHSAELIDAQIDGLEKYNDFYFINNYYYDLVLFDMTQETDYQVLEAINKINNEQIFIIMIDANEIYKLSHLINHGNVYLLLKPFDENSINKILYKASKYIINERLANEHLKVAEAFNDHLQKYNDTLNEKLAEQAKVLEQNQSTIINQSKFAIMGEMIAMIAHQWKQPLNVISLNIANLEMMQITGKYSKKELSEIIENSNETIEYMSKTIHDFTEFLKPSDIKETTKICTIFYQLVSLVKADIAEYRINFNINFKVDKESNIELNSSKFTQVIINIIKNSIDEFKSKHILEPMISIEVEKEDNVYIISVQDNAGGIPDELLTTIFEPYVSTKGKNGTGLGMYMSKLLVVSHLGGAIDVVNKNGGALFTIKLSVVERRARERIYV